MITNEIGAVIREHRKRLGLTLQEMQKRTGINNGNLSKIERGQQSLTNESMKSIAAAFGMSLSELFSAQRAQAGNLGKNVTSMKQGSYRFVSDFDSVDQIPEDEFVVVGTITPTIDPVRGGMKVDIDQQHGALFSGGEIASTGVTDTAAVGVHLIEDDAMEPRLFKGDTVMVDMTDLTVPATGGVFCVILDDEIAFRRLMTYPGRGLRVICDNPKYPEAVLDHRQATAVQIVGRVKLVRSSAGL